MFVASLILAALGLAQAAPVTSDTCPAQVTITVTAGAAVATSSSGICTAPADVAGYTTAWSCQTAAADGDGYISSYTTTTLDPAGCAAACSATSGCTFFNVYTENFSDGGTDGVCVLWNQAKGQSTVTNSYNKGVPITFSNGYSLNTVAAAVPTTTAAPTTSAAPSPIAAAATTAAGAPVQSAIPATGYSLEWSGQTGAANCAGYITSGLTSTYDVAGCAAQCTGNSACAFFNVYQQYSSGTYQYVCVLWSQDQPYSSCGTNTYNNGSPISSSAGYVKVVAAAAAPVVSSSTPAAVAAVAATTPAAAVATTAKATTSSTPAAVVATTPAAVVATTAKATTSSTPAAVVATTPAAVVATTAKTSSTSSSAAPSASVCANGNTVPALCSGQNQFVIQITSPGYATTWLAWSASLNDQRSYAVSSQSQATAVYLDPVAGRIRTCPCVGYVYKTVSTSDPLNTDNWIESLTNGVNLGSQLTAVDKVTNGPVYYRMFTGGFIGVSSSKTDTSAGAQNVITMNVVPVTV